MGASNSTSAATPPPSTASPATPSVEPPSTSPSGECVVCGEPTTKRRSACAAHGTNYMWFCSQEHQKLVWKVHRQVCGERSNPFLWPDFTDKEFDE
ncbi:hypothetical protein JCM10212_004355 [Sporobolomyces blumeae]